MQVSYNGWDYTIEQIEGNLYRIFNTDRELYIVMSVEYRSGTYFNIQNVTKGEKEFKAQRYIDKWIPLAREAAFVIAKEDGIYDYQHNKFFKLKLDKDNVYRFFPI